MSGQTLPAKPIGKRLTELMREHDMRSEDVASSLIVSHRTVTRWLTGANEPTPTMARRLGALFAVDWRSFYEDEAA